MGAVVQKFESDEALATAGRRALVFKIADSELFLKAPRLREFLLYAAECTLENKLADVREQVIAERVFGRKPDFQGAQDSIVRAEARNLRKRLETYFATEGHTEPMAVTMPRGGYSLAFEPRLVDAPAAAVASVPAVVETVIPAPVPEVLPLRPPRSFSRLTLAALALAVAGFALAFYWHRADQRLTRQLGVETPILPFSVLYGEGGSTTVVTSDTGFLQISTLAHKPLSLNDYIARSYPDVPDVRPPDLIRNWNRYEFTDGREMAVAGMILHSYPQFAARTALRSGHEVTLDDLKAHSSILIGSPISNPWAQLFEDKLNFRCSLSESHGIVFSGNAGTAYPSVDDLDHNRTYARLAFLPASFDTPPVLLIAGTTAQSTEAAGELVADQTRLARTLRTVGIDPAGPARFFEILLRSNSFVGGSTAPELAAWRLSPAPESR